MVVKVRLLFGLVKAVVADPGFGVELAETFAERARYLEAIDAGYGCEACDGTGVTTLGFER